MGKDFYKILNVERNASQEEIKKAYRKLALKWHPDRCPPEQKEEAQKKFQDIGEAFEVLSDPEKKRIYDQVGEEGLRGGVPDNGGEEGGPGGAHFSFGGMPGGRAFHFSRSNAEDIFKQFFGTGDPFQAEGADPFASFMMGGGSPLGGMGGMGGGRGMHFSSMGGGAPFGGMGGMGGGAPFSGMSGMGGMGGMGGGAPERKADPIHQPLNGRNSLTSDTIVQLLSSRSTIPPYHDCLANRCLDCSFSGGPLFGNSEEGAHYEEDPRCLRQEHERVLGQGNQHQAGLEGRNEDHLRARRG